MRSLFDGDTDQTGIRPLIIMTIQDLEDIEGSVSGSEFSLATFLTDYLAEIQNTDRLCSVRNFMAHSKYNKKLRPSPVVYQQSIESLDRARLVLFPKQDTPAQSQ
jgi:hypothetical protein